MACGRTVGVHVAVWVAIATLSGSFAQAQQPRVDAPRPHAVGQSVTPSFEGWYPNPNGTFSLVFGYLNRNYEERLDIAVGPNNKMEPGPEDRGQPTHFLPRRQTGVFAVVVPADFGERELVWSLTASDETIAIPGYLRPEWQIDALEEATNGNRPPVLAFEPGGETGQGPGGITTRVTASVSDPTTIEAWITDDGIRSRARSSRAAPGVIWSKYRGPGAVTFDDPQPQIDPTGRSQTRVTFGAPGQYVLRVLAWDESGAQRAVMAGGFFCCWTNGFVSVDVQ